MRRALLIFHCSGKHFTLHKLFCNHYLDIPSIIGKQPELQLVGVYCNGDYDAVVGTLHQTTSALGRCPTLFGLECDPFVPVFASIGIFPELTADKYYPWEAIRGSFDNDVAKDVLLKRSYFFGVYIYLTDFSDLVFVRRLVALMVRSFAEIRTLTFVLQSHRRTASTRPMFPSRI